MPTSHPFQSSSAQKTDLPAPDAIASAHSAKVVEYIRQVMDEKGGAISFADFMELALYAPGLGYYSAGSHKFGAAGDFVTAPEVSSLFAKCLARSIRPTLEQLEQVAVMEIGAGSGVLARDLIAELDQLGCPVDEYFILERSADLRERQQQTLAASAGRVNWLDQLPEHFSGVVLANEVLDALPVHYIGVQQGDAVEAYVTWQQDHFDWQAGPLSDQRLAERVLELRERFGQDLADGYVTEINLAAEDWVRTLGQMLERGLLLLIDYGFPRHEYYHPQRHMGTLMCHYRHYAHGDVFWYPGLQDLTAHVDFTAIAEAAVASGLAVNGYTNQANFLLGSGLLEIVQAADAQLDYAGQIRQLTLPQEMGELFKVIGFTRQLSVNTPGFMLRDLTHTL